eukprot:1344313-Amorphochlora_amoeboformis.AAC.2
MYAHTWRPPPPPAECPVSRYFAPHRAVSHRMSFLECDTAVRHRVCEEDKEEPKNNFLFESSRTIPPSFPSSAELST